MGKLNGQAAIVTGSSRGIGKAIALTLAREGCRVTINYVNAQAEAEATAEEARREGAATIVVQADVSKSADVDRLMEYTLRAFDRIDILVNNAGIYLHAPLDRLREEDWDRVIETNLKSVYLCCKAVAKPMRDRGHGHIVNITSTAGMFASARSPAYSASKAGVIALTRSLAEWFAPQVMVNAVAAGWIDDGMSLSIKPDTKGMLAQQTPLKRFGQSQEIANIVRFLVTEEHFMTGQVLSADGGLGNVNWFLWR